MHSRWQACTFAQDERIHFTITEHIESQGQKINKRQHQVASEILQNASWISDTGIVESSAEIPANIKPPMSQYGTGNKIKADVFKETIDEYNDGKEDCDKIKNQRIPFKPVKKDESLVA